MIVFGILMLTLSGVIRSTSATMVRSRRFLARLYEETPPFLFPRIRLLDGIFNLLIFIGTGPLMFIGTGPLLFRLLDILM